MALFKVFDFCSDWISKISGTAGINFHFVCLEI
jgi:hypothetical protein